MTQERYECEACKKCEDWNQELKRCDFEGVCEHPVNPKILDREYEYMQH